MASDPRELRDKAAAVEEAQRRLEEKVENLRRRVSVGHGNGESAESGGPDPSGLILDDDEIDPDQLLAALDTARDHLARSDEAAERAKRALEHQKVS
jgi:hypothetical protein